MQILCTHRIFTQQYDKRIRTHTCTYHTPSSHTRENDAVLGGDAEYAHAPFFTQRSTQHTRLTEIIIQKQPKNQVIFGLHTMNITKELHSHSPFLCLHHHKVLHMSYHQLQNETSHTMDTLHSTTSQLLMRRRKIIA